MTTARKDQILAIGLEQWPNVSARSIAKRLKTVHSAVLYHFGNSVALHDAIATEAVRVGDKRVVPLLIVSKHKAAASLDDATRRAFLGV